MSRLRVQCGGGFIHQQHLRVFQKAAGDGDALLFAAGQAGAVFAAQGIFAPLGDQLGQPGQANGPLYRFFREIREQGDVFPDGGVKDEHVLLNDGDQVIQRGTADVPKLLPIVKNLPGIASLGGTQQVQQGGLAAAGCADNGVAFARFKRKGNVSQNRLVIFVGKSQMGKFDALCQRTELCVSFRLPGCFQCGGRLGDQRPGRLPLRQTDRDDADGADNVVHQLYEKQHRTDRQAFSRKSQDCADQKDAQLSRYARQTAHPLNENADAFLAAAGAGQAAYAVCKQSAHLLFRLKGLDDGEAAQRVLQRSSAGFVLIGQQLFGPGGLPAHQKGGGHRQQRQQSGG